MLQRTAEGSREAFEKLYAHYYAGLYRFIAFIIDSHEDTEEIIQDIFLKVWVKKETLVGIRSFEDYLFRMARNRVFDLSASLIVATFGGSPDLPGNLPTPDHG